MPKLLQDDEYLLLFEDFYEEYHDETYRYILKKIGNPENADDLVSEIFVYCYEHFSDYDPAKAPIGVWLHVVTKSRLLNYYRDHKISPPASLDDLLLEEPSARNTMDKTIEIMDLREKIAAALTTLSPIQKQLIILRYFQDMSTAQMALETGLTPANVRTILSRALDKIERYWKFHGWEL